MTFYENIGFVKAEAASADGVAFFPLAGGGVLALYGLADLARDAGLSEPPDGFGGISLSYNARSRLAVDKLVARFVAAGGRLLKAPHDVFWGGYVGYVADPDGHVWEIAFNPHWRLEEDGSLRLPG
jgi:catechol 2,3-dioxygenase-like lactoylglutathione lyase family enzyme